MVRIAPVKLQYNPKTLWFDPGDLEFPAGTTVIVETDRGTEFGTTDAIREVEEGEIKRLKCALKPVKRIATDEDIDEIEKLKAKSTEAMPVFRRLAEELAPDMNPVMVEYLFGGEKAIFFFESEDRVDFRELVRRLAGELHIRVDMRQIGVRDQARMVGGLGHCGQELCCKRLGGEFCPVSIRMAKEQDLSLNPQKISGVCGRLMCCLRYEYEAYKDFKGRAPKQGAKVDTPDGPAKVRSLDCPKETVTIRMEEDGKQVTFPLSIMDKPEEGRRPHVVTSDEFEDYANPDPFAGMETVTLFGTSNFTGTDKLGEAVAKHNPQSQKKKKTASQSTGQSDGRKRRRRKSGNAASGNTGQASSKGNGSASGKTESENGKNRNRNNRRRKNNGDGSGQTKSTSSSAQQPKKTSVRPGQKSSGLARGASEAAGAPHRKARRRSHKTGGSEGGDK